MKIYTKTGDSGTTGLYSGERVSKSDPIFDALGDLDELSAAIGICLSDWECMDVSPTPEITSAVIKPFHTGVLTTFKEIQERLIDIGSSIATISGDAERIAKTRFSAGDTATLGLETRIDEIDAILPPLKNFILPGGVTFIHVKPWGDYPCRQYGIPFPAHVHMARSIARRAERKTGGIDTVEPAVKRYLNRLSDYLFVVARLYSNGSGEEIKYSPIKGIVY